MFAIESSTSMNILNNMSSMAFFKGMEEAKMFLPRNNVMVNNRGCKDKFDMDGEKEPAMGRSSQQTAALVHTDSEEEDELRRDWTGLSSKAMTGTLVRCRRY